VHRNSFGRIGPACTHALAVLCTPQEKNIKHTGNISMDDIIEIARIMKVRSCAKNLAGTCKEMLGTAVSVGCTVDHCHPSEIIDKVGGGQMLRITCTGSLITRSHRSSASGPWLADAACLAPARGCCA
jgi:hypothetical protein